MKYIPNNMEAASAYFARNLYDNSVETTLESNNQTLRFGIRGASYVSYDWTIFDNFRLYYHGGSVISQDPASEANGYDITTAMAPYLCTGSLKDWTTNGMVSNYNAGSAPYTNSADGSLIGRAVPTAATLPTRTSHRPLPSCPTASITSEPHSLPSTSHLHPPT